MTNDVAVRAAPSLANLPGLGTFERLSFAAPGCSLRWTFRLRNMFWLGVRGDIPFRAPSRISSIVYRVKLELMIACEWGCFRWRAP
jgi:hypothetical protein